MRTVTPLVFATLVTAFVALPIIARDSASKDSGGSSSGVSHARAFEFTYQVTLDPAPTGTLRVWIPVATSDASQRVVLKSVSGLDHSQSRRDSEYGNSVLYTEIGKAAARVTTTVTYEVTRKEYSRGDLNQLMRYNRDEDPAPSDVAVSRSRPPGADQ